MSDDDEPPTLTIGLQALPPPGDMRTQTPYVTLPRTPPRVQDRRVELPGKTPRSTCLA
jgi:hypothetical protein